MTALVLLCLASAPSAADAPRAVRLVADVAPAPPTAPPVEAAPGPVWVPLIFIGAGAGLIVFGTASVIAGVVLDKPVVAGTPPWLSTVLLASSVADLAAGVALEIIGLYKLLTRSRPQAAPGGPVPVDDRDRVQIEST